MPSHRTLSPREFFTGLKSAVGRTLPRKICFLSAAGLLVLLALYTVLGFFVLPLTVHRFLSGYVQEKLHLQLRMEAVRFNPFLLKAEVVQLRLEEPGGALLAGFRGFAADLEWSSLWKGVWTLSELSLEEPGVNITLGADGALNLTRLQTPGKVSDAPGAGSIPPLRVERLKVARGEVTFTDKRHPEPVSVRIQPLDFDCVQLSTLPTPPATWSLEVGLPDGGALHSQGNLALHDLKSSGTLTLEKLKLSTPWSFLKDQLRLQSPPGILDLKAEYALDFTAPAPALDLKGLELSLSDLALQSSDAPKAFFQLGKFQLAGARLDLAARKVEVGNIVLQGGAMDLLMDEHGKLNVQDMMASRPPSPPPKPAFKPKLPANSPPAAPASPWQILLKEVEVQDFGVTFLDQGRSPAIQGAVSSLDGAFSGEIEAGPGGTNVLLHGISGGLKQVRAGTEVPGDTSLGIEAVQFEGGKLNLRDRAVEVSRVRLEGASIPVVRNAEGQINWERLFAPPTKGTIPPAAPGGKEKDAPWRFAVQMIEMVRFGLDFSDLGLQSPQPVFNLEDLALQLGPVGEPKPMAFSLSFKLRQGGQCAFEGEIQPDGSWVESNVHVSRFPLVPLQPYLDRFVLLTLQKGDFSSEGTFRYQKGSDGPHLTYDGQFSSENLLLTEPGSQEPFFGWKSLMGSALNFSLNPSLLKIREMKFSQPFGEFIIEKDRTVNLSRVFKKQPSSGKDTPKGTGPRSASPGKTAGEPFPLRVDKIHLENGLLNFADLSMEPQFATKIHQLTGVINGLSSSKDSRTQVQLKGNVDDYGDAAIKGEINPFDPVRFSNIHMTFRNVEMTKLTPYSGRFAGRKINSGKLSLDLQYKIKESRLLGDNKIVVDQLTLGEKVESPDALDLPLDLAVALLKDSRGRINIGLPVEGDLNDPQFNYGQLIGKALKNFFGKILTSPIRFLGGLLGKENEGIEAVAFDPGTAILSPPEREKLQKLSTALKIRPNLSLSVQGRYSPTVDGDAMKSLSLRRTLAELLGTKLEPGEDPGPLDVSDPRLQPLLEKLFSEKFGKEQLNELKSTLSVAASPLSTAKGGPGQETERLTRALFEKLLIRENLSDLELQQLAEARAKAIVSEILRAGGIPAQRLSVKAPEVLDEKEPITAKLELIPQKK